MFGVRLGFCRRLWPTSLARQEAEGEGGSPNRALSVSSKVAVGRFEITRGQRRKTECRDGPRILVGMESMRKGRPSLRAPKGRHTKGGRQRNYQLLAQQKLGKLVN